MNKILILAANPLDTPRLRLDEEIREIEKGLERAKRRDDFVLKQQLATQPRDLRRAMLDFKPNIVHFCGHGEGHEGIAFVDQIGNAQFVNANALAGFFELFADSVECVILNACYSEVQAKAIAQYIPYVVGMKRAIGDVAAIEFAVAFYDALGAGESVEFSYRLACNAIQWANLPEHLTPVLEFRSGLASEEAVDGNSTTISLKDATVRSATIESDSSSTNTQKRRNLLFCLFAVIVLLFVLVIVYKFPRFTGSSTNLSNSANENIAQMPEADGTSVTVIISETTLDTNAPSTNISIPREKLVQPTDIATSAELQAPILTAPPNFAGTATHEVVSISDTFETIISTDPNVENIKGLINDHKAILDGVPQYFAGTPLIEDIMDFPVDGNLTPDFTRFIFQPHMSQIPNYIIFIEFLSPVDHIFLDETVKSPEVEKKEKDIASYIDSVTNNYDSYSMRAVTLDTFNIPLSTLQGSGFPPFLQGVIVVGRRKLLTMEQLNYLSEQNKEEKISIITYDSLIEYSKQK